MRRVLGKDGRVAFVELTRGEWKMKHRDFKLGRLGKDGRCLTLDTTGGTVLVTAVEVEREREDVTGGYVEKETGTNDVGCAWETWHGYAGPAALYLGVFKTKREATYEVGRLAKVPFYANAVARGA